MSHDYIIILIIAGIIVFQILIFANNMAKIKRYKKTIKGIENFEIVEVSVPEDWIKEIDVEEILQNPEEFQKLSTGFSSTTVDTDEDPEDFYDSDEITEDTNEPEEVTTERKSEKKGKSSQELDFPEDEETSGIEEFEEGDFEDSKTNR